MSVAGLVREQLCSLVPARSEPEEVLREDVVVAVSSLVVCGQGPLEIWEGVARGAVSQ